MSVVYTNWQTYTVKKYWSKYIHGHWLRSTLAKSKGFDQKIQI